MVFAATASQYRRFLAGWVGLVSRSAWLTVMVALLATIAALIYVRTELAISTDTTDMLSPELPFRQDARRLDAAFPQLVDNMVVVVDGATADQAVDGADALAGRLRQRTDVLQSMFDPKGNDFFRRNGLLYLEMGELEALVDRLAGAQAFLGALGRDPSLRGLFHVLGLALTGSGDTAPPGELATMLEAVAQVAELQRAARPGFLSWREIMEGGKAVEADRRRILVVRPRLDFASLQPASAAIEAVREAAVSLKLDAAHGVRVRLTGPAPMAEEELASVAEGMGLAAGVSLVLVLGLLFWGLRSLPLVISTLTTLFVGLVWTAAFATFFVGRLNLISVAFAVLFIGLSVDFGIHFALRFREAVASGHQTGPALCDAAEGVGGALTFCAVAAAIAFFSFLPTDYVGLAELGLIAGGGMFIALIANLILLPALITLMWPSNRRPGAAVRPAAASQGVMGSRPGLVIISALVLGGGAAALVPAARFDFDPLSLRDPATESVSTMFDLMGDKGAGHYSVSVLVPDLGQAARLADRLGKLEQVDGVVTLHSFVPGGQDEKLAIIDQAALFLLPALAGDQREPPTVAERRTALAGLRGGLAGARPDLAEAARRLDKALGALADQDDGAVLAELERRLVSTLGRRLGALRVALTAEGVSLKTLPSALRDRQVATDGSARVVVYPRFDLRDRGALARFVAAVRHVAPRATGGPVVIYEAGHTVVSALVQAALTSVILISLLVLVLLRSLRDTLLIFAPLALAALLSVAATVVLDTPFNFANVIVLPLLFGLGVASGIHYVLRERDEAGYEGLQRTSTPRAVVFSALTTIGSFGSIGLSNHPGTASMGILLTIAITLTLISTLVVLPALMARFHSAAGGEPP